MGNCVMEKKYIIIYDIANNKHINKISSILLDYGIRIQKSVFEVHVHDENFRTMKMRLHSVINPAEDGIKIFQVCESCLGGRRAIGTAHQWKDMASWIVI